MKRIGTLIATMICAAAFAGCSTLGGGGGDDNRTALDWQRVARGTAGQDLKHDVLTPDTEGPFKRLRLQTQGNVEFDRIVINFRNGQRHEPNIRELHTGNPRVIDLPGEAKRVESIELWYRAMGRGEPDVVVFGAK